MATVYVPTPLRQATGGRSKLTASGRTVKELLDGLERTYPGIRQQLCDETGEIRSFINVFVNGTEIRQLEGLLTPVQDADEVSIIPAMAGGLDEDNGGRRGPWGGGPEGPGGSQRRQSPRPGSLRRGGARASPTRDGGP